MNLFESIKPLFTNKPLIVVANKVDVLRLDDLPPEKRTLLEPLEKDDNIPVLEMSTSNLEGVIEVKTQACERNILAYSTDEKQKKAIVDGSKQVIRIT